MGFIFGLMIGSMAAGGGASQLPANLGAIPLRCIYLLLDVKDEAGYRKCRFPSLSLEIREYVEVKDRQEHLSWEIAALRELAAKAQPKP